ncbi:MAG: type II secretion system protein M [Propionivibrio sp.]|nr:type II secretion system protein M [Propionivibrio sp.]
MKESWFKVAARYDALLLRERWLIAAALLGGIVLIGYSLFVEPSLQRARLAERSLMDQRAQLSALQAQSVALQSPEQDPDVAARAELDGLKKQLGELSARLSVLESSLVPPQRMTALLEDMIGRKSGLRLLSLKTLPLSPLLEKQAGAEASAAEKSADKLASTPGGLFKHGVEIRLEGSYQELTAYLERLEQAKSKLLWSSVSLAAEQHPKLVLTLIVYTLSLDRAWLIV